MLRKGTRQGFTLIEMITVIGVMGLALPATFAILFSIFRQQTKILALKEVKRQGDQILSQLETVIRSADSLGTCSDASCTIETPETCTTQTLLINNPQTNPGKIMYFNSANTRYILEYTTDVDSHNQTIHVLKLTGPNGTNLIHNKRVSLTETGGDPDLTINCDTYDTTGIAKPLITFEYTVRYNTLFTDSASNQAMHYRTSLRLRNAP